MDTYGLWIRINEPIEINLAFILFKVSYLVKNKTQGNAKQ